MVKPYKLKKKERKNNNKNNIGSNQIIQPKESKYPQLNLAYTKIRKADNLFVGIALILISVFTVWIRLFSTLFDRLIGYDTFYFYRESLYYAAGGLPEIDEMAPTVIRNFRVEDTQGLTWTTAMIAKMLNLEVFTVYQYFGPAMGVLLVLLVFVLAYLWWKNKYLSLITAFFASVTPGVIYRTAGNFVEKDTMGIVWALLFLVLATLMLTTESKKLWILALVGIPLTMMAYANTFGNFFFMPISIGVYLFLRPLFEKESEKTIIHRIKANTNVYLLAIALLMSSVVYVLLGVPAYGVGSPDNLRVYLGGVVLIGGLMADLLATVVKKRLYYIGVLAAVGAGTLAFAAVILNYNVIGIILDGSLSKGISGQGQLSGLKDFNDKFYLFWPISLIGAAYAFYKAWASQETKGANNMFGPDPVPNVRNVLPLGLYISFMFYSYYMLRNTFYGGVFVAIMAAYALYAVYEICTRFSSAKVGFAVACAGLMIMAPLAVSNSVEYSNSIVPHINNLWAEGLDWLKENTPEDEVICNWWDYGYWMQAEANKKTISDGMRRNQDEWIGGYAELMASSDQGSLQKLKVMEDTAFEKVGNKFQLNYVVVDTTLLIKTSVLNNVMGKDVFKTSQVKFVGTQQDGNTFTSTFASGAVVVTFIEKQGTYACYLDDIASNRRYGIREVIVEQKGKKNPVLTIDYKDMPTINQPIYLSNIGLGIIFSEELKDTMLMRMVVYENVESYSTEFDNGYVKIYKVK